MTSSLRKTASTKKAEPVMASKNPNDLHTLKSGTISKKDISSLFGKRHHAGHARRGIDQSVGASVFPDGEPWARAFPYIEDLSVGVRSLRDPLQHLLRQCVMRTVHILSPLDKQRQSFVSERSPWCY
jgi:hypothetical protein